MDRWLVGVCLTAVIAGLFMVAWADQFSSGYMENEMRVIRSK